MPELHRCEECRENPADYQLDIKGWGLLKICDECLDKADFDLQNLKIMKKKGKRK